MFSANNFYDFFRDRYGWDKTQSSLWVFQHFGSKNLADLKIYEDRTEISEPALRDLSVRTFAHGGSIIMHDQEPFLRENIELLREHHRRDPLAVKAGLDRLPDDELMLFRTYSMSWPIFCHSQKNSKDIEWIRSIGMIDCHYFWHGLVSRDWFRHWRHYRDLMRLDPAHAQRFLLYARGQTGTRQYRRQLLQDLSKIKHQVLHNWSGQESIPSDYSAHINVKDAVNSAVHIVAETVFDRDMTHLTEKIFKPIVMSQPFVVLAGAGSLQYLQSYGFKTFGDIWDESYDRELDHATRYQMVIDQIMMLASLSDTEFFKLVDKCQFIVEHNFKWFFSEQFESIMLDELDTNITSALQKQKDLVQQDPGGSLMLVSDRWKQKGVERSDRAARQLQAAMTALGKSDPDRLSKVVGQYPWTAQYLDR